MSVQISMIETNNEYKQFVEKFKPKKTTDDCYTPPNIYEAIKTWVCEKYGVDPDEVTITPPTVNYGEILKPYKVYEKVKAVTVETKIVEEENDTTRKM